MDVDLLGLEVTSFNKTTLVRCGLRGTHSEQRPLKKRLPHRRHRVFWVSQTSCTSQALRNPDKSI